MFVVGPAVAATNVPRPHIGDTPADVGLAYEGVTLHTEDGVSLAGWYVPSANRAAVVLLHGAGSTRSDVLPQAAVLVDAGFGVLMVDARGHGDSGGRAMDFGWHGDADIAAATAYLASRADVDPQRIGAVGMSMGGEEAIGATGTIRYSEPSSPRVRRRGRRVTRSGSLDDMGTRRGAATTGAGPGLGDRYAHRRIMPTSMRSAVERSDVTRYLLITAGNEPDEGYAATYIAGMRWTGSKSGRSRM